MTWDFNLDGLGNWAPVVVFLGLLSVFRFRNKEWQVSGNHCSVAGKKKVINNNGDNSDCFDQTQTIAKINS